MCADRSTSMPNPSTSTSFSTCRMPARVPATERCRPSDIVPASLIRLRQSGLSVSVTSRTASPRSAASSGRVDVAHLVGDDVDEDALEGGQLEHGHVGVDDLARDHDVELLGDLTGHRREQPAELLGQRDARPQYLGDHAAGHVDRVGDQLPRERQLHRPRHRHPGLLLRLFGAGAEVRGDDHVGEGEQRRVGTRLGGEDVDAGAADPTIGERAGERLLVDDAAAGGVDDDHRRLDRVQLGVTDEPDRLRRLRQVHRDQVGLAPAGPRATPAVRPWPRPARAARTGRRR